MFLGVEHFHDQLYHPSRREILTTVAAQIDAYQFLVGHALGIDICAGEIVFG